MKTGEIVRGNYRGRGKLSGGCHGGNRPLGLKVPNALLIARLCQWSSKHITLQWRHKHQTEFGGKFKLFASQQILRQLFLQLFLQFLWLFFSWPYDIMTIFIPYSYFFSLLFSFAHKYIHIRGKVKPIMPACILYAETPQLS